VADEDKAKLLDCEAWAIGITIRAWVRKENKSVALAPTNLAKSPLKPYDMDCSASGTQEGVNNASISDNRLSGIGPQQINVSLVPSSMSGTVNNSDIVSNHQDGIVAS
jgi:hypothetical protein